MCVSARVYPDLPVGIERLPTLRFNKSFFNTDPPKWCRWSLNLCTIFLPLSVSTSPAKHSSRQRQTVPGFLLPNTTAHAKSISSSKNLEHSVSGSTEFPVHLKSYFQGCDTGRKQCQLPLKIVTRDASGPLSILRHLLDGCHLKLQRCKAERPEVSGLDSDLLNYCEEVVWQRGTRRRSGIRHLFIIRRLLLSCSLWSTDPPKHLTLFQKQLHPDDGIMK